MALPLKAEATGFVETQVQYKNWGTPEPLMIDSTVMEKTVNHLKNYLLSSEHMKTQVTEEPEKLGLYLIFDKNLKKPGNCVRMDENQKIIEYSTELARAKLVKLLNINDVPKELQADS